MIGKSASCEEDGAVSGGSHGRGGDLRDDNGTNDVNRVRSRQVGDARDLT